MWPKGEHISMLQLCSTCVFRIIDGLSRDSSRRNRTRRSRFLGAMRTQGYWNFITVWNQDCCLCNCEKETERQNPEIAWHCSRSYWFLCTKGEYHTWQRSTTTCKLAAVVRSTNAAVGDNCTHCSQLAFQNPQQGESIPHHGNTKSNFPVCCCLFISVFACQTKEWGRRVKTNNPCNFKQPKFDNLVLQLYILLLKLKF